LLAPGCDYPSTRPVLMVDGQAWQIGKPRRSQKVRAPEFVRLIWLVSIISRWAGPDSFLILFRNVIDNAFAIRRGREQVQLPAEWMAP
jgi:hypothetical protein